MWRYDDARSGMRDALRLAKGMTYKTAVAALPLGGGKGVVMLTGGPPQGHERRAALLDFADTVTMLDGAYVTAEDVGTSTADMEVIASRTRHVSGLDVARGGSGDPSPYTALGVVAAMRVACERAFGSGDLRGRSVALAGLGHVGAHVAELLVADGARLLDVYAPCALGGVLDDETVPRLQAPVVAGAANNQLAGDGVADLLAEHGVLWAPDFVANAGGIINIAVERRPEGYDPAVAREQVLGIADTTAQVLDDAAARGVTTLAAAVALAERNLAGAGR
jgi:leucine dehydrogenase